MRVILGGVRGTSTVTNPNFAQFGGDTTSYLIKGEAGDEVLVDFGSGLRELHSYLYDPSVHRIALITHYHLDHLNGFPVFPYIYNPSVSLQIVGPRSGDMSVKDVFSDMMARPFWPLQIHMLQAGLDFETLPDKQVPEGRIFGSLVIRWCPVHHPGGCMAYRIDEPSTGQSVIIATDMEWQLSSAEEQQQFLALCREPQPAKLLLFDGHFTPDRYEQFKNWGHSTWRDGVDIATETNIERLVIIHHAPEADDERLQKVERNLQQVMPSAWLGRQRDIFDGTEKVRV